MVSSIPIECKYFLNRSILPIGGTLTSTTIPRRVLPKSSRTLASRMDAVFRYIQGMGLTILHGKQYFPRAPEL